MITPPELPLLARFQDLVLRAWRVGSSPCSYHHVSQGKGVQVLTHVLSHFRPHCQKDALALVLAGAILVGSTEVTGNDWTVNCTYDLTQGYLLWRPGQDIASTHASL